MKSEYLTCALDVAPERFCDPLPLPAPPCVNWCDTFTPPPPLTKTGRCRDGLGMRVMREAQARGALHWHNGFAVIYSEGGTQLEGRWPMAPDEQHYSVK